jgi:hypothetical protein
MMFQCNNVFRRFATLLFNSLIEEQGPTHQKILCRLLS